MTSVRTAETGREKRRFPRYFVEIPVFLRKKTGDQMLMTADVSRHGAFIKCDAPVPLRQLVQLRFRLPDHSEIDAMCMVARWLPQSARGPGIGVDFFALSKEAKSAWERFLADLKAKETFDVAATPGSLGDTPRPPAPAFQAPPRTNPNNTSAVPLPGNNPSLPPSAPAILGLPGQPPPALDLEASFFARGTPAFGTRAPGPSSLPPQPSSSSSGASSLVPQQARLPNGAFPEWMSPNSLTAAQQAQQAQSTHAAQPARPQPASSAPASSQSVQVQAPSSSPGARAPQAQVINVDDIAPITAGASGIVMLRLPDRDAVKNFIEAEIGRGGMFLKTPLVKDVGEKVEVVLVHPETDDEFHLDGTVVRRVVTGPMEQRGLGIFFRALTPAAHARLVEFAESGLEVIELGKPISERQMELEAAVAREPDSAEALEALGSFLLDEEGDLGGALTMLTRALIIGPSQVSIHAALARAYRKIGDGVKVRAHERVAEALMLHQDRLKVRLGVGDEPENG